MSVDPCCVVRATSYLVFDNGRLNYPVTLVVDHLPLDRMVVSELLTNRMTCSDPPAKSITLVSSEHFR